MKKNMLEVINSRRTIRKYKNKRVNKKKIKLLLEAARNCQSAHNIQPWKFIVVENKEIINKIANFLLKKSRCTYSGFNILLKDTAKVLVNTPAIIAIYNTKALSKKVAYLKGRYTRLCELFEIQSIAAAIQNISIGANILKLGLAWLGITVFCEKDINRLLGESNPLMAILSIGYPDEHPKKPKRKDIHDISYII